MPCELLQKSINLKLVVMLLLIVVQIQDKADFNAFLIAASGFSGSVLN